MVIRSEQLQAIVPQRKSKEKQIHKTMGWNIMYNERQLKGITFFCSLLFFTLVGNAFAEMTNKKVDDDAFESFVEDYKNNPDAILTHDDILTNLNSQQFEEMTKLLGTNQLTYLYPVIVRANELDTELTTPIDSLSVMTVKGGKLIPIPFQFDELDKTGLVYIEGSSKDKLEGEKGLFDESDELLFMYRDAGVQRFQEKTIESSENTTIVKELALESKNTETRYVYIVENSTQRAKADYVSVDLNEGELDTTFLSMKYNPKNMLNISSIRPKLGSKSNPNIIDSVYIEMSTGVFNKNFRVKVNSEKNLKMVPKAVKDGPIRSTLLVEFRLAFGGVTVMRDQLNVSCYEQAFNVRSRFAGDSYAMARYVALIIKEPRFEAYVDFVGLDGAKVAIDTEEFKNQVAVVDGKMSPLENSINKARLPGDWIWLKSTLGWDVFVANSLPVVPGGLFDSFLEGMEMSVEYEDEKYSYRDFERFPGASPRIGVMGSGLPIILLRMMSALKDVPFEDLDTFNESLDVLIALDDKGKLKNVDSIIQEVLVKLRDSGKIPDKQALADAYIADLAKIGFNGIARDDLNTLARHAIMQVKSFDTFSLGDIFRDFRKRANELNIDLSAVQYKPRDNTIYFPSTAGMQGPSQFNQALANAPRVREMPSDSAGNRVAANEAEFASSKDNLAADAQ